MKWKTMTKRAPSWLRSGRGGAILAAFHKEPFILAGRECRELASGLRFAGVASRFARHFRHG